jgi:aminoglycoside phosphotransferase (APT) family kinase protein
VDREFRVISALAATDVPVARALALCEDDAVIGTAFYVMEYVPGRVFWDPQLPELAPAERAAVHDEINRVIAALHCVDYAAAGLGDYGRPGSTSRARWRAGASSTGLGDREDRGHGPADRHGCRRTCRPATRRASCTATTASTT